MVTNCVQQSQPKPELFTTIKELNERINKCAYIVFAEGYMIGSAWKADLNKYLLSDGCLATVENALQDVQLIYGFVLDPAELPYEIPPDIMEHRSIYLISNSPQDDEVVEIEEHSNIVTLTESIESAVEEDDCHIDDFAVVVAEELEFSLAIGETGETILFRDIYG